MRPIEPPSNAVLNVTSAELAAVAKAAQAATAEKQRLSGNRVSRFHSMAGMTFSLVDEQRSSVMALLSSRLLVGARTPSKDIALANQAGEAILLYHIDSDN
jgi:hypothetical protein